MKVFFRKIKAGMASKELELRFVWGGELNGLCSMIAGIRLYLYSVNPNALTPYAWAET